MTSYLLRAMATGGAAAHKANRMSIVMLNGPQGISQNMKMRYILHVKTVNKSCSNRIEISVG